MKCPHCNNSTVQMVDHEPIDLKVMPYDTELYGNFQCLDVTCLRTFDTTLTISIKSKNKKNDTDYI